MANFLSYLMAEILSDESVSYLMTEKSYLMISKSYWMTTQNIHFPMEKQTLSYWMNSILLDDRALVLSDWGGPI